MTTYIEDLVQNIYTNCDMKGLDELNQGLKDAIWYSSELDKNLRDANKAQRQGFDFNARAIEKSKEAYTVEKYRLKLQDQTNRYRLRINEMQEKIDERKQRRQDKYNKSLERQNGLFRLAKNFILSWISIGTLKNIIDTGSRLQLVRASIEGLTKSTQDWQYIQQQAFKTGTEIEVVAKGYRNFYSSAKMAGFDKSGIQSMYADTLLATRAIGASTQQTEGALLALEQMLSKGTVSMEELRRQLGNAIPGAFEIGAAAMKMTTKEFNEFVKKGQLASAEFVPKFIKQLKDTYADGFKNIEQTVSVAQIRLSNSWKLLTLDIMNGETGKAFAQGLNVLRETLDSPEFKQAVIYLGKIFTIVVKLFSFVIKNLRLVLMLLGVRGFFGLLARNAQLFSILNMGIKQGTIALINFAKTGVQGMGVLNMATLAFLKSLARVIAPLLLIEDLIFFIGEAFLGWNTKSAIGSMISLANRRIGKENLAKTILPEEVEQLKKSNPQFKKAIESGDWKTVRQILKPQTYDSFLPSTTQKQGMNYEKDESQTVNVHIGNINLGGISGNMGNVSDYEIGRGLGDVIIETGIISGNAPRLMGATSYPTNGKTSLNLGQK